MPFNKNNKDEFHELRPRFKLLTDFDVEKVKALVCSSASLDPSLDCEPINHRIRIKIPMTERHYWSPELQMTIEVPDYEEHTEIRCLIGPSPKNWTFFMFIYSLLGSLTFFAGMFGAVQLSMGKGSIWLFIAGVGALGLVGVFLVVYFGKKQGHEQMMHLIRFVYKTLGEEHYRRVS